MPTGVGSAAAIGSSIAGGVVGSSAAGDASKAAQAAASSNNAYDKSILAQTTSNFSPYINNGSAASNEVAGLEGLNGATGSAGAQSALQTYLNSTNYQFTLGQGENAVKTAGAASFNSGATAKALDTYATGQAGSALSGYLSQLNTTSGQGLSATSSLGSLSNQTAGMVNSNTAGAANAEGSADLASANSITQALKSLTGTASGAGTASSFGNSSNPVANPVSQLWSAATGGS